MTTERICELDGTRCLKRNDESLHLTITASLNSKAEIKSQENLAVLKKSYVEEERKSCSIEVGGRSSQDKWKNPKPQVKWKGISHNVDVKKNLGHKLQGKLKKRNRSLCKIRMAEDAKVDGVRNRIKRGLEQLRKDREEERAATKLQEELQENVEKAQERVLQLEEELWKERDEYKYSWEQER